MLHNSHFFLSICNKHDCRFCFQLIEILLITDSISKVALLKSGKFDVSLGDAWLDKSLLFELKSFDLKVQGKDFHSN